MTSVAEKVGEAKERPAPEKRRALGRGLESLLPGPRVVAGSAVSPAGAPRTPAAGPPAVASPAAPGGDTAVENSSSQKSSPNLSTSSGAAPSAASTDGVARQAAAVPTLSESARKDGAATVDSGAMQEPGVSATERREPGAPAASSVAGSILDSQSLTAPADGPIESRAASPMAGLERAVVRNEDIGTASVPTRVGAHPPTSSQTTRTGGAPSANGIGDLQGVAESSDFEGVQVTELPLDKIDPNPYQTRHFTQEDEEELVELGKSIKAQGLIQPITVREGKNGRYVLIAGDRRTRASRLAELKTIPAIIWEVGEQEAAEMTIIENLMREDLNCMDQTRAFMLLSSKFHMTQAEIAERMGMSRESVSNYMRLARLPQAVQDYLINGELEYSHARMLLKIDNDEVLLKVAHKVAKEHIPVWELEEMMLSSNPTLLKPPDEKKERRGARWVDPNVRAAQRDLERVLGMRVRIRDRNNKGRIVIEYSTLEDFDRVVGALKKK